MRSAVLLCPLRLHRQGILISAVISMACVVSACTITQPIPEPASGSGYFAVPEPAASAPGETVLRVPAGTELCRIVPNGPGCFADGLGEQIEAVERRRNQYLKLARETSNGNASYNALLYPFGAAAVYEKLRGAPNHKLLLPAVAAAGLYGFMNAGVAEREKFYLSAAAELQCAVVRQSASLYRRNEIEPPDARGDLPGGPNSLESVIAALDSSTMQYAQLRLLMLTDLKAPEAAAGAPGAIERRKTGTPAAKFKDMRADIIGRSAEQLLTARQTLELLRQLRADIGRAAWRLHLDVTDIEREVQSRLSAKVDAPKEPAAAAKALLDGTNAIRQALAQGGESGAVVMDPTYLLGSIKDTDAPTTSAVLMLASHGGAPLARHWAAAQSFAAAHAARAKQAAEDLQALGCQTRLSALPVLTVKAPPSPKTAKSGADAADGSQVKTSNLPSAPGGGVN